MKFTYPLLQYIYCLVDEAAGDVTVPCDQVVAVLPPRTRVRTRPTHPGEVETTGDLSLHTTQLYSTVQYMLDNKNLKSYA